MFAYRTIKLIHILQQNVTELDIKPVMGQFYCSILQMSKNKEKNYKNFRDKNKIFVNTTSNKIKINKHSVFSLNF